MSKSKGSPRKFSEKIALLNRKEAETTAEYEKILKEVEETTRAPPPPAPLFQRNHLGPDQQQQQQQPKQYWNLPTRSSSFSSWQTSGQSHSSHVQQQQHEQQQQQQNHSQYLTEPIQYDANHQLHHQQQQQQQVQHIDRTTRLRPTVYIDQQQQQQQQHRTTYQTSAQQQLLQQHINQIDVIDGQVQPRPIGVPNIEIFPIDDDRSYQQQQVTSAPDTADCLTNGHFHHDSSNSSISSARSLPNIATLSVSPSSPLNVEIKGQFLTQTVGQRHQSQMIASPTSTANDNHLVTTEPTSLIIAGSTSPASYAHNSSINDYFSNDEYCSLPTIHEPVTGSNHLDQNGHQSRTQLSRTNSWQHVVTSSAPSSAAPTPPAVATSAAAGYRQQSVNSPNSSPHSQQHSPQNLHQNYYQATQVQSQGQLIRASSTNFINNDLLEAPRINNNLSKSSDGYYGYLDDYNANDTYYDGGLACNDDNFGHASLRTNSLMRSCNEIDNIPRQAECKQATNQCVNLNQQQFPDAQQYQFYG